MKALVYHGPGQRSWDEVPYPVLQADGDVIVKISSSTICGTDLHILKGDVPEVSPARSSATRPSARWSRREPGVTTVDIGDRVLVSCITSCGRCRFCKEGKYGLCSGGGGWIFGHLIDGLQAEYARVPFADTSVYKVPEGLDGRAGALRRGHPADRVRGRRAGRRSAAGRHGCDRRRRPDRARRDHDREAADAGEDRRRSTSPTAGSSGRARSEPT